MRQLFGLKVRVWVTSLVDMNSLLRHRICGALSLPVANRRDVQKDQAPLGPGSSVKHVLWLAAQQDFGAKLLCNNINALARPCRQ